MAQSLPVSNEEETAFLDRAKQLLGTITPGAVNPRRPDDHNGIIVLVSVIPNRGLTGQLGSLVSVVRMAWRLFVCRRALQIPIDANGATVHKSLDACLLASTGKLFRALDIGVPKISLAYPGFQVSAGEMVAYIVATEVGIQQCMVPKITFQNLQLCVSLD